MPSLSTQCVKYVAKNSNSERARPTYEVIPRKVSRSTKFNRIKNKRLNTQC